MRWPSTEQLQRLKLSLEVLLLLLLVPLILYTLHHDHRSGLLLALQAR
jgi:hypothetical protein